MEINRVNRWRLVILGILVFICLGTIYSWSIFRGPLEDLYQINATLSGLPYMTFLVFYAASMPITGIILRKQKHWKVILIGGVMVGSGWILSSFSQNIATLIITLGVVAGTGVGAVYGSVIASVACWFSDKKGLATGLTLSGFGLSPFITAPLARYFIDLYGAMDTLRFFGIAFFIVITLSALTFKSQPEVLVREVSLKNGIEHNLSAKQIMRSGICFALWACFGIGTFNGLMAVSIAGPVGQDIFKLDEAFSAIMVSVFAVFNCIGRPLFGWLTDRIQPKKSIQILFVIIFAAAVTMIAVQSKTIVLYFAAFALLWLSLGGWLAVAPAATAILFGSKNLSKNYGIVFTAYGVGAILGIIVSGMIRDISGSYQIVFYPMMISAVLGFSLSFFIRKKL